MQDILIQIQSKLYVRPPSILWGLHVKGVDVPPSSQDEQVQIIGFCYPSQKHKARQVFQDAPQESANIISQ